VSLQSKQKSKILILTICSFNKASGPDTEYDVENSIASILKANFATKLLKKRSEIFRLIKTSSSLDWQGVPLNKLEFNNNLVLGPDLGGNDSRRKYLPAIERYRGRFFLALGDEGKLSLLDSAHHFLILSGLYGILSPLEPIQLYSCPLKSEIVARWKSEDLLTEILISYINDNGICRIFDLTAIDAYRKLVDWGKIREVTAANVFHCYSNMATGDFSLVQLGELAKNYLIDATQEELLKVKPDDKYGSIVFRSTQILSSDYSDEVRTVKEAELELPLLQSYPLEHIKEAFGGGLPPSKEEISRFMVRETPLKIEWQFALTSNFQKDVSKLDKKLQGHIMAAIIEICRNPQNQRGDTAKPLSGELKGNWRYRIGDYRLIYFPNSNEGIVYLLKLSPRGDPGIYDST